MPFKTIRSHLAKALLVSPLSFSLLSLVSPPVDAAKLSLKTIDEVYVFGDSSSDVGNLFNAVNQSFPPPPYFEGRFTNGLLWAEQLTLTLGLNPNPNTNFAWGGATTGSNNTIAPNLPGLFNQISEFTGSLNTINQSANPNALYIISAGVNDYLFDGVTDPTEPVNNLLQAITSLSEAGAKNILVSNILDLGQTPATRNTPNSTALSTLSQVHQSSLSIALEQLSQVLPTDINVIQFDAFSAFNNALANPTDFGFTDVTNSCLISLDPLVVCNNPDEFLFWDELHPSASGYKALAGVAFSVLQSKSVPEADSSLGLIVVTALSVSALIKHKSN